MMKEWTVDGTPPVIDVTPETAPARPTKRKVQLARPRARWAMDALAGLAIWLAFTGVFLLISRPLGYAPADMIAPMVLQAVGMFIVYVLIAFIAWRTGRLV